MGVERGCWPQCRSEEVVKYGTTTKGKPRFRCQPTVGCDRSFLRAYAYQGRRPLGKPQIVEMTPNGGGGRDIARVLQSSPMTVSGEVKKRRQRWPTSPHCCEHDVGVSIQAGQRVGGSR
jgi:transposase-like protein